MSSVLAKGVGALTGEGAAARVATVEAGAEDAAATAAARKGTALPESYWIDKELPRQVTPGTKRIDLSKPSGRNLGEVYEKTGHYDEYGRQAGITDRTSHGEPNMHPNPHHHRFDPATGARIRNPGTGAYIWPGEYPGE
jgi:hypothetical protein